MVAAIFKNRVLAAAGTNEHEIKQLEDWTHMRKGRFSLEMDDSVTHLLCTDEQFKNRNKNKIIRDAMERNKDKNKKVKIKIVHVDWFTFSCTRNKKLRESDYDSKAIRRREDIKRRKQKEEEECRIRNAMLGQEWINPDLYHVWSDKYHFRYEIQLFRKTEDQYGAVHDKYELYIFESNAKPPLYWFGAKLYQKKDDGVWRLRGIERPSTTSGLFDPQYELFKNFFEIKTKYRWCDRVLKAGTGEKTDFSYMPPTRGKPVGGRLSPGLSYDELVKRNVETRLLFAELFGDELPASVQIDVAMTELLDEIIDKACAAEYDSLCDAVHQMWPDDMSASAETDTPIDSINAEEQASGTMVGASWHSTSQPRIQDTDSYLESMQECEMEDAMAPSSGNDEQHMELGTYSE